MSTLTAAHRDDETAAGMPLSPADATPSGGPRPCGSQRPARSSTKPGPGLGVTPLHPTPTRLALLQAVADGDVKQVYPLMPDPIYSELDRGYGVGKRYVKVTAKVDELERAGWVRLGERESDRYKAPRRWRLTDAGRAVLEGAR